jgi:hypothetical protein
MMRKIALLLAGILVLSSLSFAAVLSTDRYLYIQYFKLDCKAAYAQTLLGDFDIALEYTGLNSSLTNDTADLYTYAHADDRAGFATVAATTRADTTLALRIARALRVYDIANGIMTKGEARTAEHSARLAYWSCTTGIVFV